MSSDALLTLRRVNDRVRSALEHFHADQTPTATVIADDFSNLLADLLLAGECLKDLKTQGSAPASSSSAEGKAIDQETNTYRGYLEQLRQSLPDLHARLLAERARLQTAQTHIAAAAAWAKASGKTL